MGSQKPITSHWFDIKPSRVYGISRWHLSCFMMSVSTSWYLKNIFRALRYTDHACTNYQFRFEIRFCNELSHNQFRRCYLHESHNPKAGWRNKWIMGQGNYSYVCLLSWMPRVMFIHWLKLFAKIIPTTSMFPYRFCKVTYKFRQVYHVVFGCRMTWPFFWLD